MARILILTPQLPYPPQSLTGFSQGTTIRNFNLLAGLARRHTVDLLTFLTLGEQRGGGTGAGDRKALSRMGDILHPLQDA